MSACVTQTITAAPEPPVKAALVDEISRKNVGLETANPSMQNLPSPAMHGGMGELQMIDVEPTVSHRIQVLRQISCYLSLYISGYK